MGAEGTTTTIAITLPSCDWTEMLLKNCACFHATISMLSVGLYGSKLSFLYLRIYHYVESHVTYSKYDKFYDNCWQA